MVSAAKRVWIGGLVVIVFFGVWKIVPWLTVDRTVIAGSPSLGGLTSATHSALKRGQRACVAPVPVLTTVRQVSVLAATTTQPVPLRIDVVAPGYRASVRVPAYWPSGGDTPVTGQLARPPQRDVVGRVCVTNLGRHTITLAGTDEPRSQVTAQSTIAGKPVPDLSLTLYGDSSSALSRASTYIDRAATLGSLLPTFVVWLLALALVGAPLAALFALSIGFREPRADDGEATTTGQP